MSARTRIVRELQDIDASSEFTIRRASDSWENFDAVVAGPDSSPYKGGQFEVKLELPTDYPLTPPKLKFVTKIFHPNVEAVTGEVCLDILKSDWSPAWGIATVCRAVIALLGAPNADSPLNCDAGNLLRGGDRVGFNSLARMYTLEYAIRPT